MNDQIAMAKKKKRSSGAIAIGKKEKKTRKRSRFVWFAGVKKRNRASSPSSTSSSPETRKKTLRFYGQLKDMKKLSGNNEAFYLSFDTVYDIVTMIKSRKTPTYDTYRRWDVYAVSFYLKMCTCFGVDYQNLEAATPPQPQEKPPTQPSMPKEESLKQEKPPTQPSTKEEMSKEKLKQEKHTECTQPSTKEMSDEERHLKILNQEIVSCMWLLDGPFEFGNYACGTKPYRIPYHLYMLVKEAVDIMNTTNDLIDLKLVERKIYLFCHYLHSHLPIGWNYSRDDASSLLARGYETTQFSKFLYVPNTNLADEGGSDSETGLTPRDMANMMSIIHSRKTPIFWNLYPVEIMFYCKLCSCFGLDYHRLEAASEDDVCLLNVGY